MISLQLCLISQMIAKYGIVQTHKKRNNLSKLVPFLYYFAILF